MLRYVRRREQVAAPAGSRSPGGVVLIVCTIALTACAERRPSSQALLAGVAESFPDLRSVGEQHFESDAPVSTISAGLRGALEAYLDAVMRYGADATNTYASHFRGQELVKVRPSLQVVEEGRYFPATRADGSILVPVEALRSVGLTAIEVGARRASGSLYFDGLLALTDMPEVEQRLKSAGVRLPARRAALPAIGDMTPSGSTNFEQDMKLLVVVLRDRDRAERVNLKGYSAALLQSLNDAFTDLRGTSKRLEDGEGKADGDILPGMLTNYISQQQEAYLKRAIAYGQAILEEQVIFLLAHEIAHQRLRHFARVSAGMTCDEMVRMEEEADRYAYLTVIGMTGREAGNFSTAYLESKYRTSDPSHSVLDRIALSFVQAMASVGSEITNMLAADGAQLFLGPTHDRLGLTELAAQQKCQAYNSMRRVDRLAPEKSTDR